MSTATATKYITLPATQKQAVAGEYSIKGYNPRQGRDTLQFEASLYRGTKRVAVVENEGRGGAHLFTFFDQVDEGRKWDEYVTSYDFKGYASTYDFEYDFNEDAVFDLLADEVDFARELNRKARTKDILADTMDQVSKGQYMTGRKNGNWKPGMFKWNGSEWAVTA
jgi:hypothetical protein